MLDVLKFVKGATGKPDMHPLLGYFLMRHGTITATNGTIAIQAPFPCNLECAPHAARLIKAVEACAGEVVQFHLEGGNLVVSSKGFKSDVPCVNPAEFPEVAPGGEIVNLPGPILPTLRKLAPFMSEDEIRPWSRGILLSNNYAYATNNTVIVEHWSPVGFPVVANVPSDAVLQLCKLRVEPVAIQSEPGKLVFHLPGNYWISCKLSAMQWPDLQRHFEHIQAQPVIPVSQELRNAVEKLSPFVDNMQAVFFLPGQVSTHRKGVKGSTVVDSATSPGFGCYKLDNLTALFGIAHSVGFASYPNPVAFYGEGCRGAMMGYRDQ